MAITKEVEIDKIEIVSDYKKVQCREATIIKEDGVELSRSFRRYLLNPSRCVKNVDGTFTHTDTDISGETQEVQDVCAAVWTDDVKAAWKTLEESIVGPQES
jgi:hypothetical protein